LFLGHQAGLDVRKVVSGCLSLSIDFIGLAEASEGLDQLVV
jgi:hypothetical protein